MPSDNPSPLKMDRCLADDQPPCIVLRRPSIREVLHRWLAAALTATTWLYLAGVVAVWLLLRLSGDRWWLATVLLFSPRWLFALPWPVLALGAVSARRRLLWPLAAAALMLVGPITGLCLPWGRLASPAGPALRVLTCNIDGQSADRKRLMQLVAEAKPDIVAFQEMQSDIHFNWPPGWQERRAGGLLVASRFPLGEAQVSLRRHPPSRWPGVDGLRCTVKTPYGPVNFCCVHLRTPRDELSETLDRETGVSPARSTALTAATADRLLESEALSAWIDNSEASTPVVGTIVAGDFNMPSKSAIYRSCWSRYTDAFSSTGFGYGYTKWTPLGKWTYGLRIDHILTGSNIRPRRSWVGPDVRSDHLPLLADLVPTETAPEGK